MLHVPLHSFDLKKLPWSLKLVATLTEIAPGRKTGVFTDKINGKLSGHLLHLLQLMVFSHSCLWGPSGAIAFPKPQRSQEKVLPKLLDAASQHQPVASLETANSNCCHEPVS